MTSLLLPYLSSSLTDSLPSLNLLSHSKTDARFTQDVRKAVWGIPYVSVSFFPSLKQNFIAYRSSKVSSRPDCIFEIHQLWQSGFSRVYSNCCCSYSFEPGIIKIGQSSHKIYSNNIVNFQASTTILNACTKKSGNLLKAPGILFRPATLYDVALVEKRKVWNVIKLYKNNEEIVCLFYVCGGELLIIHVTKFEQVIVQNVVVRTFRTQRRSFKPGGIRIFRGSSKSARVQESD